MEIFFTLFTNLIPLYILIGLGFVAGRHLNVDRDTLANFGIFICMPVVIFGFVAQLEFQPVYGLLPLLILGIATAVSFIALPVGRRIWGDKRANLASMCASMANTGYFGLPIVLLLFEDQWVGVYMFMLLGISIHEATIGYYIAARGNFNVRDSLIKVAKFPSIYAIILGLMVNHTQMELPETFYTYWGYFKGTYVVIGMMIIGTALARVDKLVFAPFFLALVFVGKFLVWPLFGVGFVYLDRQIFGLFNEEIYRLIILMSLMPPAANITAYSAQLDLKPEKAATTVLAGTVFALFYIPAVLVLTGLY